MYDDVLMELVKDRVEERVNEAVDRTRRASLTRSILSLMENGGYAAEDAMRLLGIPEDEWATYRDLVDERSRMAADAAPVAGDTVSEG